MRTLIGLAGLSALALAAASCDRDEPQPPAAAQQVRAGAGGTAHTAKVPKAQRKAKTAAVVPDASAATPADSGDSYPLGDSKAVTGHLKKKFFPTVREKVVPLRDMQVELWINADGAVTRSNITSKDLPETIRKQLLKKLDGLTFKKDDSKGKHFVLNYKAKSFEPKGSGKDAEEDTSAEEKG